MTKSEAVKDLKALKEFFEEESGAVPICIEYAIKELQKRNKCDKPQKVGMVERPPSHDRDVIIAQAQLLEEYRGRIKALEQLNKSQGDVIIKLERLITNMQEKGTVNNG